jgi:hypothetical protein
MRRTRWHRLARRRAGRGRGLLAAGFIGGLVAGMLVWSVQMRRSRRDLFSRHPVKRLAALGYLGGQSGDDVETVQLLTEYVRWEKHPLLRRRAERLLQRRTSNFM